MTITPAIIEAFTPTGVLRASINLGNPILANRNAATGDPEGVSFDLARACADQLGVPLERVVFTFGWEPTGGISQIAPGETRVEVTLVDDGGDTIMTLRHTGIPDAFAEMHASGWSLFLPMLAAAASTIEEH